MRLAGVLAEDHGLADRACSAGYLRSLSGPERFPIFEDRGPGSTACHIEGAGALTAAEAVRRDIARGCDLVLLSKRSEEHTSELQSLLRISSAVFCLKKNKQ